jgi:hypothetical protein
MRSRKMSDTRNALETAGLSGLGALLGAGVGLTSKNKMLGSLVGGGLGGAAGGVAGGASGGLRADITDSGGGAGAGAALGSLGVLPFLKNSKLSKAKLLAALLGAPLGGAAIGGFGGHMLGDDDEDRLAKIRQWGQAPQPEM